MITDKEIQDCIDASKERMFNYMAIKNIMQTLLLIKDERTGKIRPIKNTSKQDCYDALFEIQKMLGLWGYRK